ncbi:unnamed protein product [Rhizophagus irregularis]|nr:unnamed protein product [Rhizophagus irregularis]
MGPGSLAFWLFSSKVLVLSSTTSALWHSVPHFSSKVPVLSSATSALWHFSFTHRKRRKEMTKRVIIFDALYIHKYQDLMWSHNCKWLIYVGSLNITPT